MFRINTTTKIVVIYFLELKLMILHKPPNYGLNTNKACSQTWMCCYSVGYSLRYLTVMHSLNY